MTITFTINTELQPLEGEVIYRPSEYSLDFVPARRQDEKRRKGHWGSFSLLIGQTLTLEVGLETRLALFVTGYHPVNAWEKVKLHPPEALDGGLQVEVQDEEVFSGA